ncbi:proprotein convertase P-domain-containing protein [Streptomyces sp. NPDC093595]|uniref:proprotein convertase P-domain-containing protein n=1 Tax=Streptomyces sp. NPDC093595 TaxID=3366045 RepID=UPI0037F1EBEA
MAASLSAVILATGCVGQAAAITVTPDQALGAAQLAYGAWKKYKGQELSIEQATQQVIGAIGNAEADIIEHIDQVAASDVRACASAAIVDLPDLPAMSDDTKQAFARDAGECVALADARLGELTSKEAIDKVGFALHAVGPIALTARRSADFSTAALEDLLEHASAININKLKPTCTHTFVEEDNPTPDNEVLIRCEAYNGDIGTDNQFLSAGESVNYTKATLTAERNTSAALSREALRHGVLNKYTYTDSTSSSIGVIRWPSLPETRAIDVPSSVPAGAYAHLLPTINHPRKGQLRIELKAPDGTILRLKDYDSADTGAWVDDTLLTGKYAKDPSGRWTLSIWDNNMSFDNGTLDGFKLHLF